MRNRIVVVLGVVAIALALMAFFGPWWVFVSQSVGFGGTFTQTTEYDLFGWTISPWYGQSNTSDYSGLPNTGVVFSVGVMLTVLGVLAGAGLVVVAVLPAPTPRLRQLGTFLGVFAFLLTLAAPLYTMAQLPAALTRDMEAAGFTYVPFSGFWGTTSTRAGSFGSVTYSWAAGWGWYALVAAAVLFEIGGILLFRAKSPSAGQTAPKAARQP